MPVQKKEEIHIMASGDKMVLENPRKQQAQQVNQIQEPGTVK